MPKAVACSWLKASQLERPQRAPYWMAAPRTLQAFCTPPRTWVGRTQVPECPLPRLSGAQAAAWTRSTLEVEAAWTGDTSMGPRPCIRAFLPQLAPGMITTGEGSTLQPEISQRAHRLTTSRPSTSLS